MLLNKSEFKERISSSLFRQKIPLFEKIFDSRAPGFQVRPIDATWKYKGIVPRFNSGFDFFSDNLFLAYNSRVYNGFSDPDKQIRELNGNDQFVSEFLFLVHDYLHWWAYRFITHSRNNQCAFGKSFVTKDSIEDFAFCHLLSETVATVGLDYWILANLELDEVLTIDTQIRTLTVAAFHSSKSKIFKELSPEFNHNSVDFFCDVANFYCDGIFSGFDKNDIVQSPTVYKWLRHELLYGETQRIYSRKWMRYLCGNVPVHISKEKLAKPFDVNIDWKKILIREIGEALREEIKSYNVIVCNDIVNASNKEYDLLRAPDSYFSSTSKINGTVENYHDRVHAIESIILTYLCDEAAKPLVNMITNGALKLNKLTNKDLEWILSSMNKVPIGISLEPSHVFTLV